MADAWNDIQALKDRQSSLRAKMMERRKQREGFAAELTSSGAAPSIVPVTTVSSSNANAEPPTLTQQTAPSQIAKQPVPVPVESSITIKPTLLAQPDVVPVAIDPDVEKKMLMVLCDISLDIPSDSKVIAEHTSRFMEREVDIKVIEHLLRKFASEKLISIKINEESSILIVNSLDLTKLSAVTRGRKRPRDSEDEGEEDANTKQARTGGGPESGDIESLLSMQSTKEREEKKLNEEIQALLVTQTAKEQYLVEKFKSRGGPQLQEFCQYGTREECNRTGPDAASCKRLHFKKIIRKHTDESLGDCSFLNTCFHMDTCKEPSGLSHMQMSNAVPASQNQHICEGIQQQQQQPPADWFYTYDSQAFNEPRQAMLSRPHVQAAAAAASSMDSPAASLAHTPLAGLYYPQVVLDSVSSMNHSQPAYPSSHDHHQLYGTHTSRLTTGEEDMQSLYRPNGSGNLANHGATHNRSHQMRGGDAGNNAHSRQTALGPSHLSASIPDILSLSDLPGTSSSLSSAAPTFPYSASFPFSLTAPPPAPTASAVPTPDSSMPPSVSDSGFFDSSTTGHNWAFSNDTYICSAASTSPSLSSVTASVTKTASSKVDISSSVKKKRRKKLEDSTSNAQSDNSSGKRKRSRQPDKWKKNMNKRAKLCGEEHESRTGHIIPAKQVELVDCSQCSFKCCENFGEDLRQQIFDVFYSLGSNESQKQFVCQNVTEAPTKIFPGGANKTSDVRKDETDDCSNTKLQQQQQQTQNENKRKVTRKYFLPDSDNTKRQVCVKFFCRTLAIGTTFISHALKHKQFGCYMGKERRGKPHNRIPEHLLEPARRHIQAVLHGTVGGEGSPNKKAGKKKLIEQGLNVTKMYDLYKQDCQMRGVSAVSMSMYRTVFHSYK